MHSLFALATPLALMLPLVAEGAGPPPAARALAAASAPQCNAAAATDDPVPVNPLSALRSQSIARQVRIEQRVVVRITPQPPAARQNLLADLPRRETTPRFEERGKEKCVALDGISGVQTGSGNRLVLLDRKSVV